MDMQLSLFDIEVQYIACFGLTHTMTSRETTFPGQKVVYANEATPPEKFPVFVIPSKGTLHQVSEEVVDLATRALKGSNYAKSRSRILYTTETTPKPSSLLDVPSTTMNLLVCRRIGLVHGCGVVGLMLDENTVTFDVEVMKKHIM